MRKILVLLAVILATAADASTPAPRLAIFNFKDMPIVVMQPYDENANANATLAAAFARAKSGHKRVMIDLGGNWCPDCIVLANLMRVPALHAFLNAHYEMVAVDVGRFNKNLQIPARFGYYKLAGVPMILVATPEGKLVNAGNVFALSEARTMTPQSVADYLANWVN